MVSNVRAQTDGSKTKPTQVNLRVTCLSCVEQIDLYQLHRIDPKVPADEQLGALKALQSEGKIKHIGLSGVTVRQIPYPFRFLIVPIVSVQNGYSVTDRAAEDVLDYCEKQKLGFIPWFPLAAGKLSGGDSAVRHVAEQLKATPSQVALAWLLERSPVILPIPGTSSVKHLEENVVAAGLKIDEKKIRELGSAARIITRERDSDDRPMKLCASNRRKPSITL